MEVVLHYLQSLYYQSVSDHRAQFNEAVFLVLSPSVPISPNAVLSLSHSLFFSARSISVHFCFILTPLPFSVCYYLPQVDYRTEDGTANAGSDYEFAEGTLLFKPGETLKGKTTDRNHL